MKTDRHEPATKGLKKISFFFKGSKFLRLSHYLKSLVIICGIIPGLALSAETNNIGNAETKKSDYVIVLAANATASEKFAAKELGTYMKKVTGLEFPIKSEEGFQPGQLKAIYVGQTNYAKKWIDFSLLSEEEWIIKTKDGNLILSGGRPRGTLYSVYEFLEGQLGCHWLDEYTEVIPKQKAFILTELDIKEKPAFKDRKIYEGPSFSDDNLLMLFRTRNKENEPSSAELGYGIKVGSPRQCHTFYDYSKDWNDTHPEYLAMNEKGVRVPSTSPHGPGQICLTSPGVRKAMLEKLRQYILADRKTAAKTGEPQPTVYCIESNDNNLTCQCPECQALIKREGANSGAYIDFVNFLADGIKDEFPDVMVDTFAYLQTLDPPKTIRARDNVIIRLAQLNARPNLDGTFGNRLEERLDYYRPMEHPVNRSCLETFMAWAKISKHISYWDYWIQFCDKFPTPYINIDCLKPDLELMLNNNVEALLVENEAPDTSSFFALKRWVGTKLVQNPRQPIEPLIKTFISGYYGPGAEKVYEYLNYMRKRINECPENIKMSFIEEKKRPYLDLEFFVTSDKLLSEAEALCANDKVAELHVQRERITVDMGLLGMWLTLQEKLCPGEKMPFNATNILERCKAMRVKQIETLWSKLKQEKVKKKMEQEMLEIKNMMNLKPLQQRIPSVGDAEGNPEKVDWTKAALLDKWYTLNGVAAQEKKLTGRIAHDKKYLYISLEEKSDKTQFKSAEWFGDDWEIFFAAKCEKPYRQLGVFPDGKFIGCLYANKEASKPWNSDAIVKSTMEQDKWLVQIAVPLKNLTESDLSSGKSFYCNIYRGVPKPGINLCLIPTFSIYFHDLSRMANFTLE